MQSFLSSCSRHSCLQTISEICYPSFIHSFLTYWIFLQGWYQAHTQNGYTVFLSLMISCLPTQSVIFLPLHFIIHSLLIICLFSNPKTFQVSRCACKLPQTGLCMTLTEIVYDQFQGTHWSFFILAVESRAPAPCPFFPTWNDLETTVPPLGNLC